MTEEVAVAPTVPSRSSQRKQGSRAAVGSGSAGSGGDDAAEVVDHGGRGPVRGPETFIVNTKGYIVEKIVGPADWSSPPMIDYFRGVIAAGSR